MWRFSPGNKWILVADHDPEVRARVGEILARDGFRTTLSRDDEHALDVLAHRHHDALILDLRRSGGSPLATFRQRAPATPILVLADPDRLHDAVQALRDGADDYLHRPPDPFELRTRLVHVLERHDLDARLSRLQDDAARVYGVKPVVTRSAAMRAALDRVMRVAPLRATALIIGESGVGKELIARSIHFHSPRRDFPFVAINCAAIPAGLIESELFGHERGAFTGAHARAKGKFEIAHRGTLFLDEIGEMDIPTQAKLLRVLEEREFMRVGGDQSVTVDVRVVAATNADLDDRVRQGSFRRDLYYRLKVVTIPVPPLRERTEDLPGLVETFLDELSRSNAIPRKALEPEALAALREYQWPGNVRELKNVLESLLVSSSGGTVTLRDLPPSIARGRPVAKPRAVGAGATLAEMERELIRATLEHCGGNRTHAAAMLDIGVRTLQRKILEFGLEIPSKKRRPRRRSSFRS